MNEVLFLASAMAAGFLLGAFFFGGLWWTVKRGVSSQRPALWFFGSMLLRMSITLGGILLCRARELATMAPVSPGVCSGASRRAAANPPAG